MKVQEFPNKNIPLTKIVYLQERNSSIYDIKTPEELQMLIKDYFVSCFECQNIPTVPGLARTLGLSRKELENNSYNPKFANVILDAMLRIEENLNQHILLGFNPSAGQFLLKNSFKYSDKVEMEHSKKMTLDEELDLIEEQSSYRLPQTTEKPIQLKPIHDAKTIDG